jgi:hypothetical protein
MQVGAYNSLPPQPVSAPVQTRPNQQPADQQRPAENSSAPAAESQTEGSPASGGPLELTEAEQAQVRELQQRDREVRAHEMAHVAAGGRYVTKPATYDYQTGPDGRRYAVGGEVSIDTSVPSDPQEALTKAQIIERAALAPVEPSQQDYRVAAKARQMAADARSEIAAERREELRSDPEGGPSASRDGSEASPESGAESVSGGELEPGPPVIPFRLPLETADSLQPTSRLSLFA